MAAIDTTRLSPRIKTLKDRVRNRDHKKFRQSHPPDVLAECESKDLSWMRRMALLTRRMCEAEKVIIEDDERIVFTRTIPAVASIFSPEDWEKITDSHVLHELGPVSNICADWEMVLGQGLGQRKKVATDARRQFAGEPEKVEFLDCAIETIDAVLNLTARYAQEARRMGKLQIAEILEHVPANPPRSFHEALQSLRLCHSAVWLSWHYHVGLGRFDQYMWPYLQADLKTKKLTLEEAEELLAEFFISLNKDSDLYPGVQQGDNGQSLMLGGVKRDGSDAVNELTWMVLRLSRELCLIDPKINLRISSDTDSELLRLAIELTRKGLGFPQYSNDHVVIPGLVAHGYDIEDARDYTVAACWEFIIPGKGMDVVNVDAVSMPAMVDKAIREGLAAKDAFEGILNRVQKNIAERVKEIVREKSRLFLPPAPYYSVLMDGCLERGQDLSKGAKYNNFGIHGACSANAADALAAVKKLVFDEKTVKPDHLINALDNNFLDDESLRTKLVNHGPKVGNNDDYADQLFVKLFDFFADACEAVRDNGRGGIVRPGTGSAMYYVWAATNDENLGATAEGRKKGEFFSANLAPSPKAPVAGPISVLQSFSKIGYRRICNGGPITMELSDTVFRNEESINKIVMLLKTFVRLGCQQLQLNTLNVRTLEDAKKHPERHRNLIVRVWGWSGYFCELDQPYQDQIIERNKYSV